MGGSRIPQVGYHGKNRVDCRIEADGVIGICQIIIDGPRHSHHRYAAAVQLQPAVERTVASDDDQSVDTKSLQDTYGVDAGLPRS